jgi:hypothetical protein
MYKNKYIILLIRFEWGKNKLIIYDIAKNKTNEI